MKKVSGLVKILIPALILLFVLYFIFLKDPLLSEDQENTIKLFGYPSQFTITYVPRGDADNPELVRSEVWHYSSQELEISFLGGSLVSQTEFLTENKNSNTPLFPQDFDYFTNFDDMKSMFGTENIVPIDFLPVFYEEGETATYLTDLALFVIENDRLTYFQTLGSGTEDFLELGDLPKEEIEEKEIKEEAKEEEKEDSISTENWKLYQNSMLGIKMKYPPEWYLLDEDIVLTTYDTGYMEKGLELPEKRLKCDFYRFNPEFLSLDDEEEIIDNGVKISKGTAVDNSGEDGPGMGDAVMFLFEKDDFSPISLVCFSYSSDFEEKLYRSFETFEFIE
jgi:hypothetical protein